MRRQELRKALERAQRHVGEAFGGTYQGYTPDDIAESIMRAIARLNRALWLTNTTMPKPPRLRRKK